jgi:hypothetical protein
MFRRRTMPRRMASEMIQIFVKAGIPALRWQSIEGAHPLRFNKGNNPCPLSARFQAGKAGISREVLPSEKKVSTMAGTLKIMELAMNNLEARVGIEPTNQGFADLDPATPKHIPAWGSRATMHPLPAVCPLWPRQFPAVAGGAR